jgi:hypothetical protein
MAMAYGSASVLVRATGLPTEPVPKLDGKPSPSAIVQSLSELPCLFPRVRSRLPW